MGMGVIVYDTISRPDRLERALEHGVYSYATHNFKLWWVGGSFWGPKQVHDLRADSFIEKNILNIPFQVAQNDKSLMNRVHIVLFNISTEQRSKQERASDETHTAA